MTPIEQIYEFNKQAGLLEKGYSDERECAFPIEEAIEGFDDTIQELAFELQMDKNFSPDAEEVNSPKHISRHIMKILGNNGYVIDDVDRLDKHLDIIVYSFGSLFKLGLTPEQALKALGIVMDANMSKLSVGTDEAGKQMKPTDFVGPEEKLQQILNERN